MKKQKLIKQIENVFKNVRLEDGIGLWEAQGLDDYLSKEECKKLREKDEKDDWHNITVLNMYQCSSSLSFFDAKGMRFHLPQFMLLYMDVFEQEEDTLEKEGKLKNCFCPDVFFSLTFKMKSEFSKNRFSLLNKGQIQCIIDFLYFVLNKKTEAYKQEERYFNIENNLQETKEAIVFWKNKISREAP